MASMVEHMDPAMPFEEPKEDVVNILTEAPAQTFPIARPTAQSANDALEDHPQGDEVRRQVEYYFSDENLPTDHYLLDLCGGIHNFPISIKRILGFRQMRKYKPYGLVVKALEKSTLLDVYDGRVSRKVPLRADQLAAETLTKPAQLADAKKSANGKVIRSQPTAPPQQDVPSWIGKNMLKPSGFEEGFVDGPITPAEYEIDLHLYDPKSPFSERIENAIQRFKHGRKFRAEYANVFNKWMKFGGVDVRTMFGGVDKKDLAGMDSYEKTRMLATHFVDDDRNDEEAWAIDFEGVAKAFLSSQLPVILGYEFTDLQAHRSINVLRSFYNYVLHHNACLEHNASVYAAREICNKADVEIPSIRNLTTHLPGAFNVACSTLFGGVWNDRYIGDKEWAAEEEYAHPELLDKWTPGVGFSQVEARAVWRVGMVTVASEEQLEAFMPGGVELPTDVGEPFIKLHDPELTGLEVIGIDRAPQSVIDYVVEQNTKHSFKHPLHALGKLRCKTWQIPDFTPRDAQPNQPILDKEYELWLEDHVLEHCFVGMKIDAIVRELSVCSQNDMHTVDPAADLRKSSSEGSNLVAETTKPKTQRIYILEEVYNVYCSFFTYLVNELCLDTSLMKEIRILPPEDDEAQPEAEDDQTDYYGVNGDDKDKVNESGVTAAAEHNTGDQELTHGMGKLTVMPDEAGEPLGDGVVVEEVKALEEGGA